MSLPTVVFLDRATIPRHIHLPALTFSHRWQEFDFTLPGAVGWWMKWHWWMR